jgi:hypothetical protein
MASLARAIFCLERKATQNCAIAFPADADQDRQRLGERGDPGLIASRVPVGARGRCGSHSVASNACDDHDLCGQTIVRLSSVGLSEPFL